MTDTTKRVERYQFRLSSIPGVGAYMAGDAAGDYVRHSDYAALLQQVAELESDVARWMEMASQINTDWIPANRTLAERAEAAERALSQARDFNAEINLLIDVAKGELDVAERARDAAQAEVARLNGIERRSLEYMGIDPADNDYNSSYWAARTMKWMRDYRARATYAEYYLGEACRLFREFQRNGEYTGADRNDIATFLAANGGRDG